MLYSQFSIYNSIFIIFKKHSNTIDNTQFQIIQREKMMNEIKDNTNIIEQQLQSSQEDLWRIFRILSEFVEGFEQMAQIKPSVVVFGSAREHPGQKNYELASEVARCVVKTGFGIITGGGPGIMEAANKGAKEAGGS